MLYFLRLSHPPPSCETFRFREVNRSVRPELKLQHTDCTHPKAYEKPLDNFRQDIAFTQDLHLLAIDLHFAPAVTTVNHDVTNLHT